MTRLCVVGLLGLIPTLIACGDGDASGTSPDDECGLVELDTLDSAVDVAGETVADTEIHYTDGDDTVSLGGLDVTMPMLADLNYWNPETRNITVPPTWPTLGGMQINSHEADPFSYPTIGLATFAQTSSVSVEACRQGCSTPTGRRRASPTPR